MCIYVGVLSIPIDVERNQIAVEEINDGSSNNVAGDLTNDTPLLTKEESTDLADTETRKEEKPQGSGDEPNSETDLDEKKNSTETPTTPAPKIRFRIINVPMPFYPGSIPQQLCQHRPLSNCGCMSNYRSNPIQMTQTHASYGLPAAGPLVQPYRPGCPYMPSAYMARSYAYSPWSYPYPRYF